jgi:F-type H+-transporting ATPase subunit epsilon
LQVLYGHAPLMAELGAGDVTLHGGPDGPETLIRYNVSWGFAEVLPNRVTILANDALKPEEIDVERAKQQLEHGQQLWNEAGESEAAYNEALRIEAEAEAKIASASEKGTK